ncbi:MAG: hypothetical protein WD187_03780 [Candidatus Woykebacteria bacterium]
MAQEETREQRLERLRQQREEAFAAPSTSVGGRTPLATYLRAGMVSQVMGRPGDRSAAVTVPQLNLAVANESRKQELPRQELHRYANVMPSPGVLPMPEDRFPRTLTEYFHKPILLVDSVISVVHRIVVDDEGNKSLEPVNILQPKELQKLSKSRWWTLLARFGGLMHDLKCHEERVEIRRWVPFFVPRDDYDFSLITTPWEPKVVELYWAMNPELKGVPLEQIMELRIKEFLWRAAGNPPGKWLSEKFTDWVPYNPTEQLITFNYAEVLIQSGAAEDPRNYDPNNVQVDYHANRRHGTVANPTRLMELDSDGMPIYEADGNYYQPKLIETPNPLVRNPLTGEEEPLYDDEKLAKIEEAREAMYGPLIRTKAQVQELFELNQGYGRLNFDPHPNHYRDVYGIYYPVRDVAHGIVSDSERMAEAILPSRRRVKQEPSRVQRSLWKRFFSVLSRRPSDDPTQNLELEYCEWWNIGPSHSASDLALERSAESHVMDGKAQSHKKQRSGQKREQNIGMLRLGDLAKAVSDWYLSHIGGLAERGLGDAEFYLPYYGFWHGSTDPDRGFITKLAWSNMDFDEFTKLVAGAPLPTDFHQLAALWEYFGFDPMDSLWGYESDGAPRLPERLIHRLILDPTQGGINMKTPDGPRVLEIYRRVVGDEAIRAYCHMSEETYNQAIANGQGDFLTMGYVFWRPMEEVGNYYKGFLYELWRNQPSQPFAQRVEEEHSEAELNRIHDTISVVAKESHGMPDIRHGRPDNEYVTNLHRRRATLWMRDRAAEMFYIYNSRAFTGSIFGKWAAHGIAGRTGDDAWGQSQYMALGFMSYLNPVYDALHGKAEVQEDQPWNGEDDMQWARNVLLSRRVGWHWATSKNLTQEGRTQGKMVLLTNIAQIAEWIHAYAGFGTDPQPGSELATRIINMGPEDWPQLETDLMGLYAALPEYERREKIRAIRAVFFTSKNQLLTA